MKRGFFLLVIAVMLVGAGCQRVQSSSDEFLFPQVGSTASFQDYPHWQVSGTVTVQDDRTLHFDHFTFQGDAQGAQLVLLNGTRLVSVLEELTNQHVRDVSFDESLPNDVTLQDFNLVAVISTAMAVPVSGAAFTK